MLEPERGEDLPRALTRTNARGVPAAALLAASSLTQVFLLTTLFSDDAFAFALELTSALSLVPYLLAAAFAVKVAVAARRERGTRAGRNELVIACLATFYTVFLLYAAGLKFLLLSCLVYAPGTALFFRSRREQGQRVFFTQRGSAVRGNGRRWRVGRRRTGSGLAHHLTCRPNAPASAGPSCDSTPLVREKDRRCTCIDDSHAAP